MVVLLSLSLSPFFPLDFITNDNLVSWFNPTATPGNNKVKGGTVGGGRVVRWLMFDSFDYWIITSRFSVLLTELGLFLLF